MPYKHKILVDCHVFDGNFQGTTTYLKGLYKEFISKDSNFHFFLAASNLANLNEVFGTNENVTYVKYKSSNKYIRLLFEIPLIIYKFKIDFAHFQYIIPPIKTCKYINTIHDVLFLDYPQYFPFKYRLRNHFLFKWSAKRSDIVLTVSKYSQKQIKKYFRLNSVIVTPNAVDPIFFESYDKKVAKKTIKNLYGLENYWIYISRREPRKNHFMILKAFVESGYYENYSLVLVGRIDIECSQFNNYYNLLDKKVKDKIIELTEVTFQQLVKLLRGANLSVYPSFAEGFGIPPLEAIACGVPSICSNTTAMSDFTFMKSMQFNPNDIEDIKKCIDSNLKKERNKTMQSELFNMYNWKKSALSLKIAISSLLLEKDQKVK